MVKNYDSIFVIGPTASGKTALAVRIAAAFNGEIISADSRQVYRRMNLGTGKDLHEFVVNGKEIPYHLIDICEPGEKYNIERFYHDAKNAINDIKSRGKLPVICGGSGLYIETLLKGNEFASIPTNESFRTELALKNKSELLAMFDLINPNLRNRLDNSSDKKLIRSLEIAHFVHVNGEPQQRDLNLNPLILATQVDRDTRRERISKRLRQRLQEGMIEEVESLLNEGVSPEDLKFYGLEYLWITQYCLKEISYDEMVKGLETAIHQFAKRQTTWFRRMEKQGFVLHKVDPNVGLEEVEILLTTNLPKPQPTPGSQK